MSCQLLSVLVTLSLWSVFGFAAGPTEAAQDGPTRWERVGRTDVHRGERRTSYPSITKVADGSLLVLFASQNAEQEKAGTGDLLRVRSSDAGKTWSQSRVVVQGKGCEPRAAGTLTTLKDGRIMAPFAEFRDAQATSTVRILTSSDDGKHWQVSDATFSIPLPDEMILAAGDGSNLEIRWAAIIHDHGLQSCTIMGNICRRSST